MEDEKNVERNAEHKPVKKPEKRPPQKGSKDDAVKKSFIEEKFTEYRAEFKKIVWPSRESLIKQTITVIIISLLFGAYIALVDGALSIAFSAFTNLVT